MPNPFKIVTAMTCLLVSVVSGGGCSGTVAKSPNTAERLASVERELVGLQDMIREMAASQAAINDSLRALGTRVMEMQGGFASYLVPDDVRYAGVLFEFDTPDKKDRLDQAMLFWLNNRALLQRIYQRAWLYFGDIEAILEEMGLPNDFKYIPVVESTLNPVAKSSAGAVGPWQFIPGTGTQYGLTQTSTVDMRRNFKSSTRASGRYLQDLLRKFDNDIPLALASYNWGEGNVSRAIEKQGVRNYFQLAMPAETEAYFFRVIAAKLVLEDPGKYGVVLETRPYWERVNADTVTVKVSKGLPVRSVADWTGSTYRAIKQLNPEVLGDSWGPGSYLLHIPAGSRDQFVHGLSQMRSGS